VPCDTPGAAGAAVAGGHADIGFLAVDPLRAQTLHFTSPYVQIEGCYLVREGSPLYDATGVDHPGTRVVVGVASAYALFLQRHLAHARLVEVPTSEAVVDALVADASLDVAAGVRQQMEADAARLPGLRLLSGSFMTIRQAMVMPRARSAQAQALLEDFIAGQRRSGFVAQALRRHGIEGALALP
jgi:polar amino acid transport system substrate-binding protein